MTTLATIDYEGGSLGATIGAESGWDNTLSGTRVYDNTLVANGVMGCKVTDQAIMRRNVTSGTQFRVRWYMRVPVINAGTNVSIGIARGSTTVRCAVRYESAGTLRLLNVSTAVGSSSGSLIPDEKIRCEWIIDGTGGTQSLLIFRASNSEGTTADETLTGAFTSASIDNIGICWSTSVTGFISYWDEVVMTDTPATPIGGFATGLTAPTGLAATPVSASQIDLSWNSVSGATGYDVERDSVIVATNVATTSYNDTGLTAATLYTYRVRAVK